METIQDSTKLSVQPRNHFVILKATSKMSTFMLASGKPTDADMTEAVSFEVAAIGNKVEDLNVGDKVIAQGQAEQRIDIPENEKSRTKLLEFYKDIFKNNTEYQKLVKETPKVEFVEYLLYTEFNIVAIIK